MPKGTKAQAPTVKAVSQSSKKSAQKVTINRAPVKAAKAAAVPIKANSKVIKKAAPASKKENKPPTFDNKRPSAQPKKPSSAYLFFNSEMQTQMKSMPKFSGLTLGEKVKVVSESWAKLNDKQKTEYNKAATEDKIRFDKETKQLQKKGFFINKDGKDSRDIFKGDKKRKSSADAEMEDAQPKKKSAAKEKEEKKKEVDEDIVKPKRAQTSFMFFIAENYDKVLKANPGIKMTDIAKKNGEEWGKLTEVQKKKFEKMNEKDKVRQEKEMKEFNEKGFFHNSDGIKSTFLNKKGKQQEFEKDTVMPKKIKHSYLFFFIEQQNLMKSQAKADEKVNVAEKTKKISEEWNTMTAQKKAKYEKMVEEDTKRYNNELNQLRKNGFFMTQDGVKSSELIPKKKKVKREKKPASASEE